MDCKELELEVCALMEISPAGLRFDILYTIAMTQIADYKHIRNMLNLRLLQKLHAEGIRLVANVQAMSVCT